MKVSMTLHGSIFLEGIELQTGAVYIYTGSTFYNSDDCIHHLNGQKATIHPYMEI